MSRPAPSEPRYVRPLALAWSPALAVAITTPLLTPTPAQPQGTRFLRQPDVSATHIVFTHANGPLEGRAGRRRRDPPDQLRGCRNRRRLQPGRALDRLHRPIRRQHRRLPHAGHRRPTPAAHLAPVRGCRAGLDTRRRHPLPVGARSGAHPALEVLHGATGGRAADCPRAATGLPGRHVRRRRPHRLPGDRLLGSRVAQLPRRTGAADRDRLH